MCVQGKPTAFELHDVKAEARFLDRRSRLLRWRWPEPEAEKLAALLAQRDRQDDDRVTCTECQHYRPGRCGNHRRAGLYGSGVGRALAAMLQRCPGFEDVTNNVTNAIEHAT